MHTAQLVPVSARAGHCAAPALRATPPRRAMAAGAAWWAAAGGGPHHAGMLQVVGGLCASVGACRAGASSSRRRPSQARGVVQGMRPPSRCKGAPGGHTLRPTRTPGAMAMRADGQPRTACGGVLARVHCGVSMPSAGGRVPTTLGMPNTEFRHDCVRSYTKTKRFRPPHVYAANMCGDTTARLESNTAAGFSGACVDASATVVSGLRRVPV